MDNGQDKMLCTFRCDFVIVIISSYVRHQDKTGNSIRYTPCIVMYEGG